MRDAATAHRFPLHDRRSAAVVVAVAVVLWPALPLRAEKEFRDVEEVTAIEVPVQVTVDGEPLRDLTADDFEILDNRKKQQITGFELVDLSQSGAEAAREVPVAARRHFLALFDLAFSDADAVDRAREVAANLLLRNLHPTDLVGVATYSQAQGPRIVLGFTSDRNQIRQAIETLGFETTADRVIDPLGLVVGDIGGEISDSLSAGRVSVGSGPIAEIINSQTQDLKTMSGRVARDQRKNQILALVSSLQLVGQMMGTVQGRKHVLFLSEGFDSSVLVGNQGITAEDQARLQEINQAAQEGQYWQVDEEERFGSSQTQTAMNQLIEEYRRADCTIQSIDIGRLVAGRDDVGQEGLFMLARDTGGELYTNYNDIGEAMSDMLERTSATYLLVFQPDKLKLDGKYHRLKVSLVDGPRGAEIVHRPGYYAPKPYAEQSPFERRMRAAQAVVGSDVGGDVGTSLLTAAFEMPGEKRAYAPLMVEIDGPSLVAVDNDAVLLEIYAYAFDDQGTVRDFFARKIGLDLKQARQALEEKGFKYWGHFDLDPGDYWVRVLVRDDASGRSGISASELTVPAPGDSTALLLPPFFPEPFDRWNWGREEEAERRPGAPHPFYVGEQPFFPAARPEIPRHAAVPVSLMGYNLGSGTLAVDCQLLDATGRPLREGVSMSLTGEPHREADLVRMPATFEATDVAPGDYLLVVTVKDLASGSELTSNLPISVL